MELDTQMSFIYVFLLFSLVYKQDVIRCVDFIHIVASNTASADVAN